MPSFSFSESYLRRTKVTREETLRKSIELHSALYDKGTPLISDAEYDELVREYNKLTGNEDKAVVAPVVVGTPVVDDSVKATHPAVMLSLDNAFDQRERAEAWHAIQRKAIGAQGYADLKVDGMALRVDYQDGHLTGAATRGNGIVGENVYQSAVRITDLPNQLQEAVPGRISVVGEAYIPNSHFALLNADREEAGEDLYTSPRNLVAGGMRHSDPEEVTRRGIRFFAYGLLHSDVPRGFENHSEVMEWLATLGFKIVEYGLPYLETEADIELAFETLSEMTANVDYDCDGVVVKLDGLEAREALGSGRNAPNWAFACKFPATDERTRLTGVSFSVGRTGAVTPVGEVEAVVIGDVTVTSVTLHNRDIIKGLDLRVGDTILMKRAGDVIPAVEKVFVDERRGDEREIEFPTHCPACGSLLMRREGEARIYCPNALLCPGQIQRGLEHFVGQDYMAINGVGPAAIGQLVGSGLVKQISDLYRLTWDDVGALVGYGEKKSENLLREIDDSKSRPLAKLLAALGIREVGRSASETIEAHFGTLANLLKASEVSEDEDEAKSDAARLYAEVRALDGFGPKMAESFCGYMQNPNNRTQLVELMELGVAASTTAPVAAEPVSAEPEGADSAALPLAGMKVCATGKLEGYTRSTINSTIRALGGTPQGSVTKATDLLIVGERAGSKLAKARSLGVRVVNEWEFQDMIS